MAKKAIITGATSGIGRALARELHSRGYAVGATGRRIERLEELKDELGSRIHIQYMDVARVEESKKHLASLIGNLGGMDILILNAGTAHQGKKTDWKTEKKIIDVNVRGFAALANYSFNFFEEQGEGHLVGISSIASLFGYGLSTTYNASKAFVSIYLQGYRQKAKHSEAAITVSDILPGFVRTEMTKSKKGTFWMVSVETAVNQITTAIEKQKDRAYIPKRWLPVVWLIKIIPNWVFDRL